jgi:hypothetical protein
MCVVHHESTRYYCHVLKGFEFYRQILAISPKIKFNENPSNRSRDVPGGRSGRHDESNSRFSQCYESF